MTAYSQAVEVLNWASLCRENEIKFAQFEAAVIAELQNCIDESERQSKSFHNRRVEMTRKYHQTRTSDGFYHLWSELILAATGSAPEPTFFQDATDQVFREMVIAAFPIEKATAAASGPEPGGIT